TPLRLSSAQLASSSGSWLHVIARLAPGVTLTQAIEAARAAERSALANTSTDLTRAGAVVRRYLDVAVGQTRERLLVLLGAAGFVLLIACLNVVNLVLARGTVRARELAIRAALGAGRSRLARQLLVEGLVLALGGAVVGVLVALVLVKGLVVFGPAGVPRLDQTSVNGLALVFTLGVTVSSGILIGLVPAMRAGTPALQSALREGGRGAGTGAGRDRLRAMLVVAEVALAMTLLTGSGLLIRSAWRLQHVDPGFNPSHVMTARVLLPAVRYEDATEIVRTYERIGEAIARVPGVQRAALASIVPLSNSFMTTRIAPEGRQLTGDERVPVDIRFTSPRYFMTMGMSVLDGRDFAATDDADAPSVAVISVSLAQKLWPGERPIGRRIDGMRLSRDIPNWLTVVGVVSDVRDAALSAPAAPTMYMPFTQTQPGMWNAMGRSMVLVAQTIPEPASLLPALQRAVMTVDASLPLDDAHPMTRWLAASIATARFNTTLLITLGAIALLLASVGVYGLVAYFVGQRTREIGVRMALGAAPAQIWRLVLSRGLRPIIWGAVGGLGLSLATARLLREQLYGVTEDDPLTLVAVVLTLIVVATVATFVPARRAMRVTPARALASD
ncbi:MAG TPA: ADOP family duplicated permease, partial [Gemmatimonadaceae bacterium]